VNVQYTYDEGTAAQRVNPNPLMQSASFPYIHNASADVSPERGAVAFAPLFAVRATLGCSVAYYIACYNAIYM